MRDTPYFFEITNSGGGGCNNCLCSLDPDCEFGGLMLGDGPDFDQNGVVDETDLTIMLMAWGLSGGRADLNRDGRVDSADLAILIRSWGPVEEE